MRRLICAAFGILVTLSTSNGQTRADSLIQDFDRYRTGSLTEKVFAHTDHACYLVGETLWFSLYVVDGTMHRPVDLSKIAYVEILDASNTPVLQTKVGLSRGRGQGSLYLPSSISSGNYTFRAYTRLMRNNAPDYFFHQTITIINQFVSPETNRTAAAGKPVVTFFPEGGTLVAGIPSRVAFRVAGSDGKGIDAVGAILNSANDTVARFSTTKFGIGTFNLAPQLEEYKAVLTDNSNRGTTYSFPTVHPQGVAMTLQEENAGIVITVHGRFDRTSNTNISLFGHSRQMIFFHKTQAWDQTKAIFVIPKAQIPGGISHFTVFDDKGVPVCERLYFRQPDHELALRVHASQSTPGTRRKVTLTINSADDKRSPLPADVSIAVIKKDSLASVAPTDIYPYLWLSSDLTGTIESPEYYFDAEDKEVAQHADNLMLTHGWRRFSWNDLNAKPVVFYPESRGHIVEATIRNPEGVVRSELTYLSRPGKKIELYATRSNNEGKLLFEIMPQKGQKPLVIQTASANPATTITLENPFSEKYASRNTVPWTVPMLKSDDLLNRSIAMQVEDIFSIEDETMQTSTATNDDTVAFYGTADATYFLDSYTRFPVMEEVMREYVAGVFVRNRKDGFHFLVVDRLKGGVLESPLILLDGVPVSDADRIMEIDPLLIAKLEVVGRRYFLGKAVFPGIVSYSSYQGDMAGLTPDPGSLSIDFEALQSQRIFAHPVYATREQLANRLPDRRYLLYWNPIVSTNEAGELKLEFYTSDVKGEFEVMVHGLTSDGRSGSGSFKFAVE